METMLKQRESEIREELEVKMKTNKNKFTSELQRAHEILRQREHEFIQLEKQIE